MSDEDRIYYARRVEQQRQAAAAAHSEDVRQRHLHLAQLLAAHHNQAPRPPAQSAEPS